MNTWVNERKREYAVGARRLKRYRDSLIRSQPKEQTAEELKEIKIVEDMIADMNYAIEWMRTGRQPHTRRGVDIKDAYKRSILMDMDLLPTEPPEQELRVTEAQKAIIVQIMMKMTTPELKCYLLHKYNGLSLSEIARELNLKKGTVQTNVNRAKSKVAQVI